MFGHSDLRDVKLPVGERSCRIWLNGLAILNSFCLKQAQKFLDIGFRARIGLDKRLSSTGGHLLDQKLVSDHRLKSIDVAWGQHLALLNTRIVIHFGIWDRDMLWCLRGKLIFWRRTFLFRHLYFHLRIVHILKQKLEIVWNLLIHTLLSRLNLTQVGSIRVILVGLHFLF